MILRVFPRRTDMTPTDDMAFIGNPPLIRPEADEVQLFSRCSFPNWISSKTRLCQVREGGIRKNGK